MWEEAHEWGSKRLSETITDLKGFYVKSGAAATVTGMNACDAVCGKAAQA